MDVSLDLWTLDSSDVNDIRVAEPDLFARYLDARQPEWDARKRHELVQTSLPQPSLDHASCYRSP
jgi:hypothetical protein